MRMDKEEAPPCVSPLLTGSDTEIDIKLNCSRSGKAGEAVVSALLAEETAFAQVLRKERG